MQFNKFYYASILSTIISEVSKIEYSITIFKSIINSYF
nr:MAG TPA: hypothetical protein [Caudoviricetes sp.]